jgi:hypothetical protein
MTASAICFACAMVGLLYLWQVQFPPPLLQAAVACRAAISMCAHLIMIHMCAGFCCLGHWQQNACIHSLGCLFARRAVHWALAGCSCDKQATSGTASHTLWRWPVLDVVAFFAPCLVLKLAARAASVAAGSSQPPAPHSLATGAALFCCACCMHGRAMLLICAALGAF